MIVVLITIFAAATSATTATTGGLKVFRPGHAAELERLGDVLGNGAMDVVERILGGEKFSDQRLFFERAFLRLVALDVIIVQGTGVLLLVHFLTELREGTVFRFRLLIGEKGFDVSRLLFVFRPLKDGGAKIAGAFEDD